MTLREQGDAELLVGARKGDAEAFGELYRRHVDSARAAARALTRSRADADDVTSEAFARVLRALQSGGGPEVSFRPYLITAVRNVFYDRVRRSREQPTDDLDDDVNTALLDAAQRQEDGAFAAAAFATLPERWQLVLWHTEVEGKSVSEVAPLLGLAPNAVAALAYRAREGLRQAYLQAHLREQHQAACRECSANLGSYVRDGLSARDRRKVDAHLEGCATCRGLVGELAATNTTLRAALIPALLGVPAAAYLSGLGGGGVIGWFGRLPKRQQQAGAATVAAAAIAALALMVASLTGGDASPSSATAPVTVAGGDGGGEGAGAGGGAGGGGGGGQVPPPATDPVDSTSAPSVPPSTTVPTPPASPAPPLPGVPPVPTTPAPATTRPTTSTAPPASTSTTSTTSSTTSIPAPVSISAVASQRTAALAGGELQIEIVVTNTGAATADGIVLDLPLPAGASFVRAEALDSSPPPLALRTSIGSGWSCSGTVSCSYGSLASGQQTSVVLVVAVSPSAAGTLTLTPSLSAPAGAVVQSTPVSITVSQIPGLLVAETRRGSVQAIGNSVITCDGSGQCAAAQTFSAPNNNHTGYAMQYVNAAGGTFNSSSAELTLTGTVAHAFLVWGGDTVEGSATAPNAAGRGTVSFTTPSGTSAVSSDGEFDAGGGIYTAYADVTAQVTGDGTYSVADVQTAAGVGTFGGWSLVVVEHHSSMPERLLLAVAALSPVSTSADYSFSFPLPVPMSNTSARAVAVGFEGDSDLLGDSLAIAGSSVSNPFQSMVPGVRTPSTPNTFGVDVAVPTVTGLSGSTMSITAATSNDRAQLAFLAVALDL